MGMLVVTPPPSSYFPDFCTSTPGQITEKKSSVWSGGKRNKGIIKLDSLNHVKGSNALDVTKDGRDNSMAANQWSQTSYNEKRASVQAEMDRMTKLPAHSSYATHRMRVLNKILHLMSLQRTVSQNEELELLFAGLSM